ncbi:hypothetical protein RDI58_004168 [Solanum bulbocastanum]|uniref:Uncharacterized protein n=1 Tax=Solanum bulbocastanum TaxID=147425 RepID=A0AAN8YLB8_SOLBU
MNKELLVVTS